MPLQGHWQRVNTPMRQLGRRERNMAIGALAIALAAVVALVLATVGDSRPEPSRGCIYALVPGVMGATPIDACGAHAASICARRATFPAPAAAAIAASCRRAGLL